MMASRHVNNCVRICMCDMTDPYTCHDSHDSFICVPWLIRMWAMTHSYVCNESFLRVAWLSHVCAMTHSYVCHDSFICVTRLIHVCDMTHWFIRVIWVNSPRAMTSNHQQIHSYVSLEQFAACRWKHTDSYMWYESILSTNHNFASSPDSFMCVSRTICFSSLKTHWFIHVIWVYSPRTITSDHQLVCFQRRAANCSGDTYEWVLSHMSHGTHIRVWVSLVTYTRMSESCQTHSVWVSLTRLTHTRMCVPWLVICVTRLTHTRMCDETHSYAYVCTMTRHMCDETHSYAYVWRDSLIRVCVYHDSFICVTRLTHTHMNECRHTYEWVMAHTWMSHGTHMSESWQIVRATD